MFKFLAVGRLIAALKTAIAGKSIEGIESVAVQLADLVGLSKEAKSLVAVVEAARSLRLIATLRAAGYFLIDVADAIAGPVMMFAGGDDAAPASKDDDGAKIACMAECVRLSKECHQLAA